MQSASLSGTARHTLHNTPVWGFPTLSAVKRRYCQQRITYGETVQDEQWLHVLWVHIHCWGLTAFHSALLDSLRAALLNALPQVGAMLQALLLDVLQRRAAKMSDLMTDMKPVLPSLLASHNHALQNNALQLLKALLLQRLMRQQVRSKGVRQPSMQSDRVRCFVKKLI